MRQVNVHEAKTHLSELLAEVESGKAVVIARSGKPVAVLSPYKVASGKRRLGLFSGQAVVHADFDELPPDLAAALGAEEA